MTSRALVGVEDAEAVDEGEVAGDRLELVVRNETVAVVVVVLEYRLQQDSRVMTSSSCDDVSMHAYVDHVVNVFVDGGGVGWTDARHPVAELHRLRRCGRLER